MKRGDVVTSGYIAHSLFIILLSNTTSEDPAEERYEHVETQLRLVSEHLTLYLLSISAQKEGQLREGIGSGGETGFGSAGVPNFLSFNEQFGGKGSSTVAKKLK